MRFAHLRAGLCVAVFYLLVISSQAQSPAPNNPPLVTTMTIESLQQRVQALGFATTRGNTDGKPDSFFTYLAEGRKVGAIIVNPDVVELFVSFKDGSTPEDLNEWNRTHYGTAAFIDQRGNAVLRNDLILEGGVTEQSVTVFITRFRDIASAYARFIADHKKKLQSPPAGAP